jgi:hypothetical protein
MIYKKAIDHLELSSILLKNWQALFFYKLGIPQISITLIRIPFNWRTKTKGKSNASLINLPDNDKPNLLNLLIEVH